MSSATDTNPSYWNEYSNLQHTKHELIKSYLNGWFPKLGYWSGRILYLDTHAGRGRHLRGQLGSPLVALTTLLEHAHCHRLLSRCEVIFNFIERDVANVDALKNEISELGELPHNLFVDTVCGDCFETLDQMIADLRADHAQMAPAFIFVDPYGFKVPGRTLRQLMTFRRVELFINVIWRELDMAIQQGDQLAGILNDIFDGDDWRTKIAANDFDDRAEQAADLLREKIGATWATHIKMLGDNNRTRYLLLHLTNHPDGRDLMKDCMWKVCPEGGFYARKSDNPSQQFLITREPDLAPLEEWVIRRLSQGPRRWQDLIEDVRPEIWRDTHLNSVIRNLRNRGRIGADQYKNRFQPSSNPRLFIPQSPA